MRTNAILIAALSVLLFPSGSHGSPLLLNIDELRAGEAPTSVPSWLMLTFVDIGAGAVQLSVQSGLNVESEFIASLVFNIDDNIDPLAILFSEDASLRVGAFENPGISRGSDSVNFPPVFGFDFGLSFATSNKGDGTLRFNLLDRLVYDLTCMIAFDPDCASFNAAQFNATNNDGAWLTLAHYQGIPTGAGSGKFGATTALSETTAIIAQVPEPGSLLLFSTGIGLVAMARRRTKRSRARGRLTRDC